MEAILDATCSIRRGEGPNNPLAADWWFDSEMPGQKITHAEAKQLINNLLQPVNDKLAAITNGQEEIKGQLRRLENPSATGWRRAGHLIVAIGSPVAIIALIVGILAFTGTAIYQLIAHVREDTAFRGNTDSRLRTIEEKLSVPHPSPLQSKSVKPVLQQKSSSLQDFAGMDEPQFSHEVGQLADATSSAQKSGKIDTVEDIAKI